MKTLARGGMLVFFAFILTGCAGNGGQRMDIVSYVDLKRFMGDWYVVVSIPTFLEKGAHNAVESYAMNPDGTIATTFRFNTGNFDGPLKTYHPKGFIIDSTTNALWGMQFIWPIKGDYRIVYLDDTYRLTVIGRAKRDYVWVMSRTANFSDEEFARIKKFVEEVGYDATKLQRVPHRAETPTHGSSNRQT